MDKDKKTVLVVEDELLLLKAIVLKLNLKNINTVAASSGKEALDYLSTTDKLPDAIWLDYYLTDMDGLTMMHLMRKNHSLSNIPVIVVSNSATPEKIHNMQALGIKKYVLKAEYSLEDIIKILNDEILLKA